MTLSSKLSLSITNGSMPYHPKQQTNIVDYQSKEILRASAVVNNCISVTFANYLKVVIKFFKKRSGE